MANSAGEEKINVTLFMTNSNADVHVFCMLTLLKMIKASISNYTKTKRIFLSLFLTFSHGGNDFRHLKCKRISDERLNEVIPMHSLKKTHFSHNLKT